MNGVVPGDAPGRGFRPGASRYRALAADMLWTVLSLGLFAGIWEAAWYLGAVTEATLPPPHIFLARLPEQLVYFQTNAVGEQAATGWAAVLDAIGATIFRVFAGLVLGFVGGVLLGLLSQYFRLFGNLVMPTVTMLAPISPLAWLPVAVFMFGAGNGPAIFLVFIGIFFIITISAVNDIENVNRNYVQVAENLGASRLQIYTNVIVPAIAPSLFNILRFNMFGAWMVVLVAEAAGVGTGLGLIILYARNTLNMPLVFVIMTIIGVIGYAADTLLKLIQDRTLYWLPKDGEQE